MSSIIGGGGGDCIENIVLIKLSLYNRIKNK